METKICRRCNQPFPSSSDYFYKASKPGKLQPYCKGCHEGGAQGRKRRKIAGTSTKADSKHLEHLKESICNKRKDVQAKLREIKLSLGCIDCGYRSHYAALDFDHRPNEIKEFNLGNTCVLNWKVIEAELKKCDVRCANCHRIVTHQRSVPDFIS